MSLSDTVSSKKEVSETIIQFFKLVFFCASIITSTGRQTAGTVTGDWTCLYTCDLKKECTQYYFTCWVQIFRQQVGPSSTVGGKCSDDLANPIEDIYEYMESSSDCPFSVKDLIDLV